MRYATEATVANAYAFNQGADARLAGVPEWLNPYPRSSDHSEFAYWRAGWRDVDRYWAIWCKDRPKPRLAEVRE